MRHSIVDESVEDTLAKLSGKKGPNKYSVINGVTVKMTSQRYEVFKESVECATCGVEGIFFSVDRSVQSAAHNGPYHLNLYGLKNGREVLMTKDHIVPKSKGGKNTVSNYQTMCTRCNNRKGNKL